jgi:hypothetical protein
MIICVVCGTSFVSPHEGRTGAQTPKYCSNKCACRAYSSKKPKKQPQPVVCVVCGTTFFSKRADATYNAAKFCSGKCFSADWKRKNPERMKAARRKTHLKHREKDLENNRQWWRKNATKLKPKRVEYQKSIPPEKTSEYAKRHYKKHRVKIRNRATVGYYLGYANPKGDLGWLRRAKTSIRNAQRLLLSGVTPEACVSQKVVSETDETSQT